jgi:ABC-type Fe3+ transport system substrate-binding protein
MEKQYFKETDTLLEITEKYPQTIDVFTANGFAKMADPQQRKIMGKSISLKDALKLKGKSVAIFSKLLNDTIIGDSKSVDISMKGGKDSDAETSIVGSLPCPVRIPLLENLDAFVQTYKSKDGIAVQYDLKAASQGAGWIETYIDSAKSADDLPDIFISAGFETFFDYKQVGRFKEQGAFKDRVPYSGASKDFEDIDIRDPKGDYSVIGVVPAVFLVNTKELGDLPMPQTWEDLFNPCFENAISLPVGDFDMFASILIHVYKKYGEDGVRKLGSGLLESLHPAEMVKSDKKKKRKRPIITIMPYFFTKMTKNGGPMVAVWPKDGAIISPIFLLTKKTTSHDIQPLIDFLASQEVGEILSHQGLFPSIHPDIDNKLEADNKFMWVGWDYIYSQDIPAVIEKCNKLFMEAKK